MSLTSLIKIYNSKFSEDFCDEVIKLFKKENGKHALARRSGFVGCHAVEFPSHTI